MLALKGIGEDRLFEGPEGRALTDVDPVDGSLQRRVPDADIRIASVGRGRVDGRGAGIGQGCQVRLPVIEVEAEVVPHLVVGEGGVDGPEGNLVVALPPVAPGRHRPVLAGQAVELVLGLLCPEAGEVSGSLVLRDAFVVDLEVVGDHVPLEVGGGQDKADLTLAQIIPVGGDAGGLVLGLVAQLSDAVADLPAQLQPRIVEG